jgi:membrane protein YqaA with SNARE-associated domain
LTEPLNASTLKRLAGLRLVATAGKALNPWLVGLVGGAAAGLGESTGYLAGVGGSSLAQRSRFYPRVERWVRRWSLLTIFVPAFGPGPAFDLAAIAAGPMRVPFHRFLIACLAGKMLRFIAVAWAGHMLGANGVF